MANVIPAVRSRNSGLDLAMAGSDAIHALIETCSELDLVPGALNNVQAERFFSSFSLEALFGYVYGSNGKVMCGNHWILNLLAQGSQRG
jgi:hypothetical protein